MNTSGGVASVMSFAFYGVGIARRTFIPPLLFVRDVSRATLPPKQFLAGPLYIPITVNHQPWIPGFDPPYVVAIVDIEEQEGLRLTTNLVGCEPDEVQIGMAVKVCFEEREDGIFVPLFEPTKSVG